MLKNRPNSHNAIETYNLSKFFSIHKNIPNSQRTKKELFCALNDVTVFIERGETVGITGSNGSGKSTFLKILAQTLLPSKGSAITRGKVVPLLKGSGGFQSELSGRDNIFLIGMIMGMSRGEIRKKFDEIVEFAGLEPFLDLEVKYYSKGMNSRLALSVICHMSPDILLLDEVLSSADRNFQINCFNKLVSMSKQGTAILIVSHELSVLEKMSDRILLFKDGNLTKDGKPQEILKHYISQPLEIAC